MSDYAGAASLIRLILRALFGIFLLLELGWELQRISGSVFGLSPFAWVHWASPVSPIALVALTVVAALLCAAGLAGFARRDIAT